MEINSFIRSDELHMYVPCQMFNEQCLMMFNISVYTVGNVLNVVYA